MEKVLLFYKFVPLADPVAVQLWQRTLCEQLELKGRIVISQDGINATVGGKLAALKQYIHKTRLYAPFNELDVKWSESTGSVFPKLSVKVRDEIVTFGAVEEIQVDSEGIVGGGTRLSPEQLHELIEQRGDDVVLFDGRSTFEAAIGQFKNAVVPNVVVAKDFIKEIEKPEYEALKNRPVVTYCTGGIRCEVLSMLMKNRGFQEVYQLDGGIVRYGERYGDDGLWEGSLYVFDDRTSTTFSDHAAQIGSCYACNNPANTYTNCMKPVCNRRLIICDDCKQSPAYCDASCQLATADQPVT